MKYLVLTFKNIKKFILFHPVMFIFLIFAQIVCCMAVYISCGMAYNMNYIETDKADSSMFKFSFDGLSKIGYLTDKDDSGKIIRSYPAAAKDKDAELSTHISMQNTIPVKDVRSMTEHLIERTSKYDIRSIQYVVYPGTEYDTTEIPILSVDTIYPDYDPMKYWTGPPYLDSEDKIFFAPILDQDGNKMEVMPYDIGDIQMFYGVPYKCVADHDYYFIPYKALPDNFVVSSVSVYYKPELTSSEIADIVNSITEIFNIKFRSSTIPEPYDPIEIQFSRMLFVISIAVMLIVIFAISKFYSFVLSTRKDTLSILRMCGCTRGKANIVYMLEIMITMLITTAAAFLLFKFVFLEPISELYPSFEDFYIPVVFTAVIGAYLVISLIIMIFTVSSATRKNITEMKRK